MDRRVLSTMLCAVLIMPACAGALALAARPVVAEVGTLSERASRDFQAKTLQIDRGLSREEAVQLQKHLAALGYDTGPSDGIVGPKTRAAIRQFQADYEEPVAGIASRELLGSVSRAYLRMLADQLLPPDQAEAAWAWLWQPIALPRLRGPPSSSRG